MLLKHRATQTRTAEEEVQEGSAEVTSRTAPNVLSVLPSQEKALTSYLEPPCWNEPCCPPARAGEQLCHLPALSGGQPSVPEVTPGGNHRAGPPPSERKIPWPTDRPQRPSRPQIMSVFESRGLVGWKARPLEELTLCRGHIRRCLYSPPASCPRSTGANTSGTGHMGLREKVRLHNNNGKHNLWFVGGGLSQCLTPHLPRNRCQAIGQYFVLRSTNDKTEDQRREQRFSQGSRAKKHQCKKPGCSRCCGSDQGLQPVPQVRHPWPPLGRNNGHGQWQLGREVKA